MATFQAEVTTRSGDTLVYNLTATTASDAVAELARTAKPSWRKSQLYTWNANPKRWVPFGLSRTYGKKATP